MYQPPRPASHVTSRCRTSHASAPGILLYEAQVFMIDQHSHHLLDDILP